MTYPRRTAARRLAVLVLAAAVGLSACAKREERLFFNGKYYPAKGRAASEDRKSFAVTVRRAAQGIEGARAAGGHEGTRYCVKNFGTSEIVWAQGPDSPNITMSGGSLVLTGRCELW